MKKNQFMVLFVSFLFVFIFSGPKLGFAQKDGDDIAIGKYRTIHSNILNEDRSLLVYLPRGYRGTKQHFPVIYMLYGNHVTTYFAEAVSILDNLGPTGRIPQCILVGIMNTNRYRDLLPLTHDGKPTGIKNFTRFLKEEVFLFIKKNYRIKDYRILVGPQAGANFGLFTLFTRPDLFNACLLNNPFRWQGGRDLMMKKAADFLAQNKAFKKFLFITYDDSDPLAREGIAYIKKLSQLTAAKKPKDFSLELNFIRHNDEFLQPLGLRKGLKKLFEKYPFPETRKVEGLKDILGYYLGLSKEYGYEVDTPEHVLTVKGDGLMERGKVKGVIEVLNYTMKKYPNAANSYFRMSNMLMQDGNLEGAKDYLKKALTLIPFDSGMFKSRLARLERVIKSSAVYRIEQEIRNKGIQAGLKKYKSIKSDPSSKLYFEENEFNALGYRLMGTGKMYEAIEIFKLNVELYPKSANAHDSLGEAYMKGGDKQNAIKNYKKSLELNPKNTNAIEMLKRLEGK